ncbi:unnamed protein product [Durusdinium trenchii]|uniref:Adenosine deaminase n=1 Tax=Durusdinium trenchii TaxID=1381693 RepID=A0ABP0QWR6_9DINO
MSPQCGDHVGCPLSLEEVRALPKVELHAHLSGSITQEKLIELLERRGQGGSFQPFNFHGDLSNALQKCFGYFAKVASVVVDLETLKECTLHVLDSFAAENCIYLELRTSPKQFKAWKHDTPYTRARIAFCQNTLSRAGHCFAHHKGSGEMLVGWSLSADHGQRRVASESDSFCAVFERW